MAAAIIDIPGIGPVAAATLAEHGYRTLKKLASASVKKLASVPGFSTARAGKVIAAANALLPVESKEKAASDQRKDKDKKSKGKGKGKKDKRGKKDKKKKKKDKKGKKRKKDKKKGKKDRK